MLRSGIYMILVVICVCTGSHSLGQDRTPAAAWLLPGVDWQPSDSFRWRNQPGYNHYLRSGLWYSQAFITVHKNIILNPAYIYYLHKNEEGGWQQEHYLMNSIIIQAKKKDFFIDDRNMIWNRFIAGNAARHFYRNRLRVMQTFKMGPVIAGAYCYDEVFLLFNHQNISRNRAAIGLSSDPVKRLNIDVTYIRQWDRYSGRLNLYFISTVWRL